MSSNIDSKNQLENMEWIHCNGCLRKTKHCILTEHEHLESDSKYECVWWQTKHTLFICCGCESITLRRQYMFSEWDDEYGGPEINFYPPQVSRKRPEWHDWLPMEIRDLLTEIYSALHSNSHRLALMGARTVIDMFVLDKIGDVGTFKQKLQALVDGGYLGSQQQEILNVALEAGNAAVHRGYKPSVEVLIHVIDVIENLLYLYALTKASNSVKSKIPSRTKSTKATS
jgi:Domain of unknown function (DUF4145)